jgi:hypothetical protein
MNQLFHGERPLFQAEALLPASAQRAFMLAHLTEPTLDMAHWMARVTTAIAARDGGMRVFADERGYIHAFFVWRVERRHGESELMISQLVMAQLGGRNLQDVMVQEMLALAQQYGVTAIQVETAHRSAVLQPDVMTRHGFIHVAPERFIARL